MNGRCGYAPGGAAEWDADENKGVHLPVDEQQSFAFYRRVNGVGGHIGRVHTEYTCFVLSIYQFLFLIIEARYTDAAVTG